VNGGRSALKVKLEKKKGENNEEGRERNIPQGKKEETEVEILIKNRG